MRKNLAFLIYQAGDQPVKKKDLLATYLTEAGVEKEAFGVLPSGAFSFDSDATNTLNWLLRKKAISSPARGQYVTADSSVFPVESFTPHVFETPAQEPTQESTQEPAQESTQEPTQQPCDYVMGSSPEPQPEPLKRFDLDPATLKYTLSSGDVVEGTFTVTRTEDSFILSQRTRPDYLVIPVGEALVKRAGSNAGLLKFANKVNQDFATGRTHKAAAERLLKLLLVCGFTHQHEDAFAGFTSPCHEDCPIHMLWDDFAIYHSK
jgi:hypothetical protein